MEAQDLTPVLAVEWSAFEALLAIKRALEADSALGSLPERVSTALAGAEEALTIMFPKPATQEVAPF